MKTDERLTSVINRSASKGFYLWYVLIMAILLYRQFWLKQNIEEFIDIGIIFFIGTLYVFISYLNQGVLANNTGKRILRIVLSAAGGIIIVNILTGQLNSFWEYVGLVIGIIFFLAVFIPVTFYLNSKWKKKNEID